MQTKDISCKYIVSLVLSFHLYGFLILGLAWIPGFFQLRKSSNKQMLFYYQVCLWCVNVFYFVIFVRFFFVELMIVPTASMANTILPDEIILVSKNNQYASFSKKKADIPWLNIFVSREAEKEIISHYKINPANAESLRYNILVFKRQVSTIILPKQGGLFKHIN